jgi:hypothetical protein
MQESNAPVRASNADDATGLQNSKQFLKTDARVCQVLYQAVCEHRVKMTVFKRKIRHIIDLV